METIKRILIIDDETEFRIQLEEFLSVNGYKVLSAQNGKEAMNVLLHSSPLPDLILLDLDMPTQNGICFWNELNDHKEICYIPTILISGSSLDLEQFIGIENFLAKPFQMEDALVMIEDVFRKRNSSKGIKQEDQNGKLM